jgi:hypothetical protein
MAVVRGVDLVARVQPRREPLSGAFWHDPRKT